MPVSDVGAVSVTRPLNVTLPGAGIGGKGDGAGLADGGVGEVIDDSEPLPHPAAINPNTTIVISR